MKKFVISIKGNRSLEIVEAEDKKIVIEEGLKFHQFLANGEEIAIYPVGEVRSIRVMPEDSVDTVDAPKAGDQERTYPLPRV